MQTQRDHVHAHQFLMGRLSSALVLGDPASAEVPARRALSGTLFGVVLAVLISIGFGVYGLIVPGGDKSWQRTGVLLVEKETGNRLVYGGQALHPVLNEASARLLLGARPEVKLISTNSLAGVPRGAPVGIPEAPQIVPDRSDLVAGPWLVCLPDTTSPTGEPVLGMDLDPDAPARPLPDGRALSVRGEDGVHYLVLAGIRYPMADPSVPVALGLAGVPVRPVPPAWLDALPVGRELAAADIPGAGTPGPEIGGRPRELGDLFRLTGDQLFVLLGDGLAPVSGTEFALLAARPDSTPPADLTPAEVAAAPRSADDSLLSRTPDLTGIEALDPGRTPLCVRQRPAGDGLRATVVLAEGDTGAPGVRVAPGTGLLAVPSSAVREPGTPALHLITDQGVRYRIPDAESASALGFADVAPVPLPDGLLLGLPTGPVLSRSALTQNEKG